MMKVLALYPNGTYRELDGSQNEKLRGMKIMGVRPSQYLLWNPSDTLIESARISVKPGGAVEIIE